MKKLLQIWAMRTVALFALILTFVLPATAETIEIDLSKDTGKADKQYVKTAWSFTKGDFEFTVNNLNPSTGQVQANKGADNAFYIYNTTAISNISKIEMVFSSVGAKTPNNAWVATGSAAITSAPSKNASNVTAAWNATSKTATWTINPTSDFFRINFNTNINGTVICTKIIITYEPVNNNLSDPELKFEDEAYSAMLGKAFESPKATQVGDGVITYSSSNPTVATVDAATGEVTLVGGGETVITATVAANDTYKKATASYTLTVEDPRKVIYSGLMENGDGWTAENINLSDNLTYVWTWDATYKYYKASSFVNKVANEADSYLISPVIDLTGKINVGGSFVNIVNHLKNANRAEFLNVVVREEGSEEWNALNISAWPVGNDWDEIVNSQFDLSAWCGKKIQLAFHYTVADGSTVAPTWEVGSVNIIGEDMEVSNDSWTGELYGRYNDAEGQSKSYQVIYNVKEIPAENNAEPLPIRPREDEGSNLLVLAKVNLNKEAADLSTMTAKVGNETLAMTPSTTYPGFMEAKTANKFVKGSQVNLSFVVPVEGADDIVTGEATYTVGDVNVPTEVDGINVENAVEAEYYTLQGVRVERPTKGLYIKVQGKKATKVVL